MKNRNEFLLIVDGSSLLATSYYASLPRVLRKEKDEEKKEQMYPRLLKQDHQGHYCNALELFFHTLFTIMTFQRPTHLVICWDAGRNTFRKELWPAYKSNRQATPAPLRQQFETAYDLCGKLGISQVRDTRYEADDFAGTIATKMCEYIPVRIFTRDKDYFQLINDDIHIWYGMADLKKVKAWRKTHNMPACLPSRVVLINEEVLIQEFGYHPQAVPMIKCLFGDPSDNIPGVSGMGENRSIKLAEHYRTVEELYNPIEAVKTKADRQRLAKLWRSWGIAISPYSVLTRKGSDNRLNAKDMAKICYELGKIRTDLDLTDCFEQEFGPELFRCHFNPQTIFEVLEPFDIQLKIGRKKTGVPGREPKGRRSSRIKPATVYQDSLALQESHLANTSGSSQKAPSRSSRSGSAKPAYKAAKNTGSAASLKASKAAPKKGSSKPAIQREAAENVANKNSHLVQTDSNPKGKQTKGKQGAVSHRKRDLCLETKTSEWNQQLDFEVARSTQSQSKSRKNKTAKSRSQAKNKSRQEAGFSFESFEQFETDQPFEVVVAGFDDGQEDECQKSQQSKRHQGRMEGAKAYPSKKKSKNALFSQGMNTASCPSTKNGSSRKRSSKNRRPNNRRSTHLRQPEQPSA